MKRDRFLREQCARGVDCYVFSRWRAIDIGAASLRMGLCAAGAAWLLAGPARGQAWVSFLEDATRISADASIINDLPCDSTCTGSCVADSDCVGFCACACEKDMAVGDLDGDGDDDLVIVRMQPFMHGGGVSNLLFLNENGTMVDRSELAEGFSDPTQDRDVAITDVDPTPGQVLRDVVVAATFGEQPRLYMNLGCCGASCSPSNPCAPGNQVPCNDPSNPTWCGLKYDVSANRLPTFTPGPQFCGVAVGDLNEDGCDDLYFVDYDNTLEDRLRLGTVRGPYRAV